MIICDFCLHYSPVAKCALGLIIPKGMSCREFAPGLEKFCADSVDFVSPNQIVEMATFFGLQKMELRKVKTMAAREDRARIQPVGQRPVNWEDEVP